MNRAEAVTADMHVHTFLSFDGKETHDTFLEKAIRCGFKTIGFCEHVELDERYSFGVHPPPDERIEELKQIRRRFDGAIEVLFGLEVSYLPSLETAIRNCIPRPGFWDYLVGSVHIIEIDNRVYDVTSPDDAATVFTSFPVERIAETYLETSRRLAASGLFSILGHADMIKRYCPEEKLPELRKALANGRAFAPVFTSAVEHRMILEINAAGLRHRHKELYPSEETLAVWKENGGEMCCYSSDSHRAEHFGLGLDEVTRLLARHKLSCC